MLSAASVNIQRHLQTQKRGPWTVMVSEEMLESVSIIPANQDMSASDIQTWQPANVLLFEFGKENLRDTTHSNPILMRNGRSESNNRPMLNAETLGALATVDDEAG
jgi:hypothetical protein